MAGGFKVPISGGMEIETCAFVSVNKCGMGTRLQSLGSKSQKGPEPHPLKNYSSLIHRFLSLLDWWGVGLATFSAQYLKSGLHGEATREDK